MFISYTHDDCPSEEDSSERADMMDDELELDDVLLRLKLKLKR